MFPPTIEVLGLPELAGILRRAVGKSLQQLANPH